MNLRINLDDERAKEVSETPLLPATTLSNERAELAAQQELLLNSLMAHGQVPADVPEHQVKATAKSLFQKRARYISRCIPESASDSTYFDMMKEYVLKHPGSHPEGVCRDASQFKEFCKNKKKTNFLKTITALFYNLRT